MQLLTLINVPVRNSCSGICSATFYKPLYCRVFFFFLMHSYYPFIWLYHLNQPVNTYISCFLISLFLLLLLHLRIWFVLCTSLCSCTTNISREYIPLSVAAGERYIRYIFRGASSPSPWLHKLVSACLEQVKGFVFEVEGRGPSFIFTCFHLVLKAQPPAICHHSRKSESLQPFPSRSEMTIFMVAVEEKQPQSSLSNKMPPRIYQLQNNSLPESVSR